MQLGLGDQRHAASSTIGRLASAGGSPDREGRAQRARRRARALASSRGVHERQRALARARPRSPGAATSVSPTAWSIGSSSRRRPPPSATTARPTARTSTRRDDARPRGGSTARRHRRGRQVALRALEQVGGPAERGDHRREALGGRAAVAAPARPRRARRLVRLTPPSASSSALSASVTSRRRGRRVAAPVRWSIDSRTSSALPAVRPSTWSMSVSSAAVGRPLPRGDLDDRARQLVAPARAWA